MGNITCQVKITITYRPLLIVLRTLRKYWTSIYTTVLPLIIVPIILELEDKFARCIYTIALMTGLWCLDSIPHTVISLLPHLIFPLSGILNSKSTAACYFNETNLLNVATMIIALAIENSNLHKRLGFLLMMICRCNVLLIHLFLMLITMVTSMFVCNLSTVIVILPVVKAILMELDINGVTSYFKSVYKMEEVPIPSDPNLLDESTIIEPPTKLKVKSEYKFANDVQFEEIALLDHTRPSSITTCFYLSVGFAATLGGIGSVTGSSTNHVLMDYLKATYPESSDRLNFSKWFFIGSPIMLTSTLVVALFMQILFLGLLRPKSLKSKRMKSNANVMEAVRVKLQSLESVTFKELMSFLSFLLAAILMFFRNPFFIEGWTKFFSRNYIGNSTVAMGIVLFLFCVPALEETLGLLRMQSSKTVYKPLITWQQVQQKLLWMSVFVIGSSYAIAEAVSFSGLRGMIVEQTTEWLEDHEEKTFLIGYVVTLFFTIFINGAPVLDMLLPSFTTFCRRTMCDPIKIMMSMTLASSFSFLLQIGTPVNAIVCGSAKIPSRHLILIGSFVTVLVAGITLIMFPLLFHLVAS